MKKSIITAAILGTLWASGLAPASILAAQAQNCNNDGVKGVDCAQRPQAPDQYQGRPGRVRPADPQALPQYRRQPQQVDGGYDHRGHDEDWRRRHGYSGGGGPLIYIQPPAPVYVEPPVVYDTRPAYGGGSWVRCANENGVCEVPYSTQVRFGRSGRYSYRDVDGPVGCNNRNFGDPTPGVRKRCDFLAQ